MACLLFILANPAPIFSQVINPLTPAPVVDYQLPYPGLLPGHPLYPLKTLRDKILLFFTSDPVKKIHVTLLISDKKLVMGQLLLEKGDVDLSIKTIDAAEKTLLATVLKLRDYKKQANPPPGLADKIELAGKKHEEVILKLIFLAVGEEDKNRLRQALGITHQALQQIAQAK